MIDWDMPDPSSQGLDAMREVRDQIEDNVKKLVQEFPKA
jgi:protein-tyrosine-phosphatase